MAAYLQSAEYAAYGVPDATAAQVNAATRLVDGRIGKPEGLLWSADANGNPAWMTNKTASRSFVTAVPIVAGVNTVTVNNVNFGQGDLGAAVVIDRADPMLAETCVITAATGNTVTLASLFDHDAGATLEYGLTLGEDADVKYGDTIQTRATPLAALLSVTGSYRGGRGNRTRVYDWIDEVLNLGAGGDTWNPFPLDQVDTDGNTGVARLLPGTVRGGFSRVRINYIAGWNYANLPYPVKQATANLVSAMADSDIPANVKMMKAGDATLMNFNSSLFDNDTENLLQPYKAVRI